MYVFMMHKIFKLRVKSLVYTNLSLNPQLSYYAVQSTFCLGIFLFSLFYTFYFVTILLYILSYKIDAIF